MVTCCLCPVDVDLCCPRVCRCRQTFYLWEVGTWEAGVRGHGLFRFLYVCCKTAISCTFLGPVCCHSMPIRWWIPPKCSMLPQDGNRIYLKHFPVMDSAIYRRCRGGENAIESIQESVIVTLPRWQLYSYIMIDIVVQRAVSPSIFWHLQLYKPITGHPLNPFDTSDLSPLSQSSAWGPR